VVTLGFSTGAAVAIRHLWIEPGFGHAEKAASDELVAVSPCGSPR